MNLCHMNPVEEKQLEINAFCAHHKVSKLFVFGSVLRPEFDQTKSDLDFLVIFQPMPVEEYFDNYLAFIENLEQLFGLKIDLVEYNAIRNPVFKRSVDKEKVLCYDREAA